MAFGPFLAGGNEKPSAAGTTYDPSESKLNANNVQAALDLIYNLAKAAGVTVDSALSATSANPIQNKAVAAALEKKATLNADGVVPVDQGGTGASTLDELTQSIAEAVAGSADLATALGNAIGGCKIQTGSYTGTGTYGASNPCSLTFDFVPQIVILVRDGSLFSQGSGFSFQILMPFLTTLAVNAMLSTGSGGSAGTATLHLTWAGSTLTWYTTAASGYYVTPYAQANVEGQVYHYLALG